MQHPTTTSQQLQQLLRGGKLLSAADLTRLGISRVSLSRLVGRGVLVRCGRGIYRGADGELMRITLLPPLPCGCPRV